MTNNKFHKWLYDMPANEKIEFAINHGFLTQVETIVCGFFNCDRESVGDYIKDYPLDAWYAMKSQLEDDCIRIYLED